VIRLHLANRALTGATRAQVREMLTLQRFE
jgi:hypothetical protein